MDKLSFGARGRYLNLASKGNVLNMGYLLLARNLTPTSEITFFFQNDLTKYVKAIQIPAFAKHKMSYV